MILLCSCKHEYQDKLYGANHRVHNQCAKGHRCTVCGNVNGSGSQKKEEKEDVSRVQ